MFVRFFFHLVQLVLVLRWKSLQHMHGNLTLDSIAVGCFCVFVVGWLLLLLVVILISNGFWFPFCDRCDMKLIMITKKIVVAFHVLVSCDPFFELPREIRQSPLAHLCIIVFLFSRSHFCCLAVKQHVMHILVVNPFRCCQPKNVS